MPTFVRVCVALLCASLWAGCAYAEQDNLQGVYVLDKAHSENIENAIDQGIADMSFVIRPIARSRLRDTNPLYQRIALSHNDTTVSVQFDARQPIEMPADGHAILWTRENNEKHDVSAQWSATKMVMHFKSNDGERVNTFSLDPDGSSMKLNVNITSPRLPKPITYVLAFRREAG